MDRYYESLDESVASMSADAIQLVLQAEYISFLQACGPMFIRGMRRTAHVQAAFKYTSKSRNGSFSFGVAVAGGGKVPIGAVGGAFVGGFTRGSFALSSKLEVKITARGLDLNRPESNSLIVTNAENYHIALETAYLAMLNPRTGLVSSIEVVPWTNNMQFQAAAGLDLLILHEVDGEEEEFPNDLKRFNYMANAEHIARMDEVMRYRYNMINHLQACMRSLFSKSNDFLCAHFVKHRRISPAEDEIYAQDGVVGSTLDSVALDPKEEKVITGARLKYILEGKDQDMDNWPILTAISDFSNFAVEYYGKCMKELSKDRNDFPSGTLYVMHYLDIDACNDVTCVMKNSFWDTASASCAIRSLNGSYLWEKMVSNFCYPEYDPAYNGITSSVFLVCR
uniref:Uncharacterized protein n=1 Tax=Corethron hystrix TaxID=216773 RepID=A0A7S1B4T6_9STRA